MKDRTILAVKGLAIIGVVLHHVTNRRSNAEAHDWMNAIVFVFDWCVLAFFCVSGYLQALSDSKKHRSFAEFSRVRFSRLIIPWIALGFFYSCVWQVVQALHIPNMGVREPAGFIGKLVDVFWPIDSQVAQQLYFFPLLFAVSMILVVVYARLGLRGMWVAAWITGVIGLAYFPRFFTGFSWGVLDWGICFYASGYLLFKYRARRPAIRVVLLAVTVVLILFSGYSGLVRSIPLWLIGTGVSFDFDRLPLLPRLGDASGTIYIYHTPFIVQPLAIAASFLHGPLEQFAGMLVAALIPLAICTIIYERLSDTRARFLLM